MPNIWKSFFPLILSSEPWDIPILKINNKQINGEIEKSLIAKVNIEKITGHKDIIILPSDFIFVDSPKFILQFAKHKLGLELQEEQCERLHQHWYRKILEKWK